MYIKVLKEQEFSEFAKKHVLKSYHQTSNYGNLMTKYGYTKEYIGLCDDNDKIVAASLILFKKLGLLYKYGYAPKGFLMDYYDEELINTFTNLLIKHYQYSQVSFIRINPEISIGDINYKKNFVTTYNTNRDIISNLTNNGFVKINSIASFEAIIPKFNAIIKTKKYNFNELNKNHKANILKANRKGLKLVKGNYEDISTLYEFIKHKKNRPLSYYQDYYQAFKDNADIFLVKIDYNEYLLNVRKLYEEEEQRNTRLYNQLMKKNNERHLMAKMDSDRVLEMYKNEIIEATIGARDNVDKTIAGLMCIRFENRVNIVISGYDKKYRNFAPNYFLHDEVIKHYQRDFDYLELNGITGNRNDKKYKGLNEFKLGFKPEAYEFIGEFDLIISKQGYNYLQVIGLLKKEFKK